MVIGVFTIPLSADDVPSADARDDAPRVTARPGERARSAETAPLKDRVRFGGFVAGPENLLAASALKPFLQREPTEWSPLVLYGPHGAGKSHLALGMAAWWRQHYPGERVQALAGSEFAQEYAQALADDRLHTWRRKLRSVSLFVLDDLGQLASKRPAQQELAATLDVLMERGAMILVTSRTLPSHWPGLTAALRSRLSGGLPVPLALPGVAARRAILERFAAERRLAIPKRFLPQLAEGLTGSVPCLVAGLLELDLRARLDGAPVDRRRVHELVSATAGATRCTVREIAGGSAKYFGLKLADLQSAARRQPLVAARAMAMYLARELTGDSLKQIGKFFGGRDHTTVLHACRQTEKLLKRDRGTRQAMAELKRMFVA